MRNIFYLISIIAIISGCATKPVALQNEFWNESDKSVAVVIHELPEKGQLYKQGGQGLLDIVISSIATRNVHTHLGTLKADAFLKVKEEAFAERLQQKGIRVVNYESLINLESYPKIKAKDAQYDRDLSGLFSETGADRIIILQLQAFGAIRAYYGFIPLSPPQGFAAVDGVMVDKTDNKILWRSGNSMQQSSIQEPVIGEWDLPPDFVNLSEATQRAIEKSVTVLSDRFFSI